MEPVIIKQSEVVRFCREHRILMTGITGIHGWPLFRLLRSCVPIGQLFGIGPPFMRLPSGSDVAAFCVTDKKSLEAVRDTFKPTFVIHAAGVCDLDVCEMRPQWADLINHQGSEAIAAAFGSRMPICYLSADLVYSGNNAPAGGYSEGDTPEPVSVAGKTFLAGEAAFGYAGGHAVVRLGLPVGKSVDGTKGGLDWIEGRFRKGRKVTLFTDEYRSVISSEDCARCVLEALSAGMQGLYHLGGPVQVSLHELGKMIQAGGEYQENLLNGILRNEEISGPPRMGNVSLDSRKIMPLLSLPPKGWYYQKIQTEYAV